MAYRNGNYTAFYVATPFNQNNLGAASTPDFNHYNLLKAWKSKESSFPFIDSHDKNYNVRDDSDWDSTLKPRLHDRLRNSKNIILFLSENTKSSKALNEEIDYGINKQGLPVIVIYPDITEISEIIDSNNKFTKKVTDLWDKLPLFRDSKSSVPVLHLPYTKNLIIEGLNSSDYCVSTKVAAGNYYFK